jgi:hypothetical protein
MAVTITLGMTGTAAEKAQVLNALLLAYPKPPTFTGTDGQWAQEVCVSFLEQIVNNALVAAAQNQAAQQVQRISLLRG